MQLLDSSKDPFLNFVLYSNGLSPTGVDIGIIESLHEVATVITTIMGHKVYFDKEGDKHLPQQ